MTEIDYAERTDSTYDAISEDYEGPCEDFICYECNENCEKSRDSVIRMDLDPDSDNDYDRMIFCPCWGEMAIFRKVQPFRGDR